MPKRSSRVKKTLLAKSLASYAKVLQANINKALVSDLKFKILVEDATSSSGATTGVVSIDMEVEKKEGWGEDYLIELHGFVGTSGKKGVKEDEAYLDGVQVGDWDKGSNVLGLNGCGIGEFLTFIFSLFAIKANNFTILLHNAGGEKAEVIYRRIGFVPTKDKGAEDEMVLYLTGKKQNKDAGQLWRENYNKLRKKLQKRIKGGKCKTFWKRAPPVFAAPSVLIPSGKGRKKRTRRKSRKKMKGGLKRCEPSMLPGSIKWITGNDKKFEDDMTNMPLDERNKENIKIIIPSLKIGGTAETNMESCMSYFTALFDKMKNLIIRIDIVQVISGPPPEPTTYRTVLQLIRPSWTHFFTGETVIGSSRDIPVHKEKKRSSYQEKQLQKMFADLMINTGGDDDDGDDDEEEEEELVAHKNIPEPKTFGDKLNVLSQLIGNLAAQEKKPIVIKLWLSKRAKLNELRDANIDPALLKHYPSPPPWQDRIRMTKKELEKQKQETKVRGGSRRRKRKCSKRTRKKRGSGCAFSKQPGICQILFSKKGSSVNSIRTTNQHPSPIGYYKLPATILDLGNGLKGIDYSVLVDNDNLCIQIGNECWVHCNDTNIFPASVAQWLVLTYDSLSIKDRKRFGWERGPPVLLYPRKLDQIKEWMKGIYSGPYI